MACQSQLQSGAAAKLPMYSKRTAQGIPLRTDVGARQMETDVYISEKSTNLVEREVGIKTTKSPKMHSEG